MTRHWITALILASAAPTAWGYDYQANAGALSYSFFNLSPNTYTLTPYGGGANPLNPPDSPIGTPASTQGWGNADGTVGFFNPVTISGGGCYLPSEQVVNNTIFYNEGVPINNVGGAITLTPGAGQAGQAVVEYSTEISPHLNAPAIADSWILAGNGNTIVLAAMASAPNMFISGINTSMEDNNYPFCASEKGLWYNFGINPPTAQRVRSEVVYTPAGTFTQKSNPNAPGFTPSAMNFNVDPNASGYVPTGGLWSGVSNPNSSNLAIDSLNLPMYPVNLSAYIGSDEVNASIAQYAAPIYGGHLTLAIGDPFLVSSYAAKILWFLVTNTGYAFGDNSLSAQDISNIVGLVAPSGADGVFKSSSDSSFYAQWLLAAPGAAATALNTMNTAASTPITQESIWGKIFSGLVDVAVDVAAAALGTLAGPEASVAVVAAAGGTAAAGSAALTSYSTNQITADFTTTVSLPAPVAQTAPPVINPSYSSNDLLGMLLTNVFVQAEVNNGLASGNPSSFALWSNYSISTDTLCTNISVDANLFPRAIDAGCGPLSGIPARYDNVLSLYQRSSYSSAHLNPWSAILTGADVTASKGYLQLGSPSTAVFQPPTQLVNLTGADSLVSGVDLSFALDSGMLGIASYTVGGQVYSEWSAYPPSLQLVKAGTWTGTEWAQAPVNLPTYSNTATTAPGYWYFSPAVGSGVVTVTGLQIGAGPGPGDVPWAGYAQSFANGTQTRSSRTCAPGAPMVITATPTSATTMDGSLSCGAVSYPLGGASVSGPDTAPLVNLIVASPIPATYGIEFVSPDASQIHYHSNFGLLRVDGYQGYSNIEGSILKPNQNRFTNAPLGLALNLGDCAAGSEVNLYLYPMGGQTEQDAIGYLACADGPPVMPYSLCTKDIQATGGIVVALTGAPTNADGSGATFDLGCVCIPSYLSGTATDYGAKPKPDKPTFWKTGGTDASGQPNGLMVGATASNPKGLCN